METSHGWFDVEVIGPGVTMIGEPGHDERVHSYLIEGDRDVAVIDTGMGVGDFRGLVASLSERDPLVLQSHAHWDHIGDSSKFERVLIHPSEADDLRRDYPNERLREWYVPERLRGIPFPDEFDLETATIPGTEPTGTLNHGDRIELGRRVLEVYNTPGHSPGGITILDRTSRLLFPADSINIGPLYLFGPQSDLAAYRRTLDLLCELAEQVDRVYPSHYEVPMTPADVMATREAFEEILSGREPDSVEPSFEVYDYGKFIFWIEPGAVAEVTT